VVTVPVLLIIEVAKSAVTVPDAFWQIFKSFTVSIGLAFTLTNTSSVYLQPAISVTLTVYVTSCVGDTDGFATLIFVKVASVGFEDHS
jgi:hypothetical protein